MSKTRRWLALAFAAALFLGALAPTAALAYRSDRPTDLPGDPLIDPPLEYGDPEPTPGGSPMYSLYDVLGSLQIVLLDSLRLRFGVPTVASLRSTDAIYPSTRRSKVRLDR